MEDSDPFVGTGLECFVVHAAAPAGWSRAVWLSRDDDDGGWPAVCRDHLVCTEPVRDLSATAVLADLQARLAVMHGMETGWP